VQKIWTWTNVVSFNRWNTNDHIGIRNFVKHSFIIKHPSPPSLWKNHSSGQSLQCWCGPGPRFFVLCHVNFQSLVPNTTVLDTTVLDRCITFCGFQNWLRYGQTQESGVGSGLIHYETIAGKPLTGIQVWSQISLLILNSEELVLAPKFDYCQPIHRSKALVAAFSLMV